MQIALDNLRLEQNEHLVNTNKTVVICRGYDLSAACFP